MKNNKVRAKFTLTDISEGLSISDVQRAALSLFSTPMRFPKESIKFMTLEEFILDKGKENER
jgi:hypothetical protein